MTPSAECCITYNPMLDILFLQILLNGILNLKVESGNKVKNRIKELRKEKRITQAELVENIGISRQYISLLEKTRYNRQ